MEFSDGADSEGEIDLLEFLRYSGDISSNYIITIIFSVLALSRSFFMNMMDLNYIYCLFVFFLFYFLLFCVL